MRNLTIQLIAVFFEVLNLGWKVNDRKIDAPSLYTIAGEEG